MIDLPIPTGGFHAPGEYDGPCRCGDLRREISVAEPDLLALLDAAKIGLSSVAQSPDGPEADLQGFALASAALRRVEGLLGRRAAPPAPRAVSGHAEAIIARLNEEAGR